MYNIYTLIHWVYRKCYHLTYTLHCTFRSLYIVYKRKWRRNADAYTIYIFIYVYYYTVRTKKLKTEVYLEILNSDFCTLVYGINIIKFRF